MTKDRLEKLKDRRKDHPKSGLEDMVTEDFESKRESKIAFQHNFWQKQWNNRKIRAKNRVKHITIITILIVFILFTINISLIYLSSSKINSNSINFSKSLFTILTKLQNKTNLENSLKETADALNELETSLKPLDQRLFPVISVSGITFEGWQLAQKWIDAISELAQFKISGQGFTSDLPRNFTDYLAEFLEKLPDLINQSKAYIFKIKIYLSWSWLLPGTTTSKIRDSLDLTEDILSILNDTYLNRSGILDFLGYQSPHKILIFNQNTGESRPTGGFIGSYLPINISQGRFDIAQSQSIYNLDNDQNKTFVSFPVSWYYDLQYGRFESHGISNLNYFSCFPDTAKLLESQVQKAPKGQSADTIIFLTPNLIQNLFDDQTEIKIPIDTPNDIPNDTPNEDVSSLADQKTETITINKANFYNQIEKITALDVKDPKNPKSAITPLLLGIIANLNTIIKTQDPIKVSLDLLNSGNTRDIQIWSKQEQLENIWKIFDLSGTQTCFSENQNNPTLGFLQANLSADKRDIFAQHNFNFNISKSNTNQKYEVELDYKRTYKNLDQLQRKFNKGNGATFIGFVLPSDATDFKISSPQSFTAPFVRPFYLLKIKDQFKKELYIPPEIQQVLDSANDLTETSFSYRQADQSFVIGTYISEEDVSDVKLNFTTSKPYLFFYPAPASPNNFINGTENTKIENINNIGNDQINSTKVESKGEGLLIQNQM